LVKNAAFVRLFGQMQYSQSHHDAVMRFCHTALKNSLFGRLPNSRQTDQHENAPIFLRMSSFMSIAEQDGGLPFMSLISLMFRQRIGGHVAREYRPG
jgi:hypothetical protein